MSPRENPCQGYTYAWTLKSGQAITDRKTGAIVVRDHHDYVIFTKTSAGVGYSRAALDSGWAQTCGRFTRRAIPKF